MRRKSRLLRRQSECASFLPLKILFSRFAFSSRCHRPLRETGKAADRRVSQIVVAQHIAATCDLQTAVPRADFLGGIRNRKICPHILDFCGLKPCFCDHLHCRPIGSIKDQHTAGESVRHPPHQFPDLLGQKVIEHPGGKEYRPAGGIDFAKPCGVFQVALPPVASARDGRSPTTARGDRRIFTMVVDA